MTGGRGWFLSEFHYQALRTVRSDGSVYRSSEIRGQAMQVSHPRINNARVECWWRPFNSASYDPIDSVCKIYY
ncbi:hypothetical protein ACFC14_18695 [Microbacterium sp. NPDC055988]|uniref:hypothetical protein n=1 Tax=Microbacterium sp. NPDC055988 TaxID=3345671 RepID=UPI0035E113F3